MTDPMAKVVEPTLARLDAALGDRYSAVLYGSLARGDWSPGRSDVNLLIILDDVAPDTLRRIGPSLAAFRGASREPPLVMGRDEWRRASDVFPIEITDMRAAFRVLRGADPLAGLEVAPADLRHALERELRGKLLRLRQGYAALADDTLALGGLARHSVGTVLLLFRTTLALLGRHAPRSADETVTQAAGAVGFQTEQVGAVLRHRHEEKWRCERAVFEEYMEAVERTARFVDQLHAGDR